MQRLVIYIKEELKKDVDLSKLGIVMRNLNDAEYNELFNTYKRLIFTGNTKKIAEEYYNKTKNKKILTFEEKYELFERIEKLGEEKEHIITAIYNGLVKDAIDVFTVRNIKKELKHFIIVEINELEFNRHFTKDYIYILLPKIINFSNYLASGDGDFKEYTCCGLYKYEELLYIDAKESVYKLALILSHSKECCSINEGVLIKLQNMFIKKDRNFCFSFIMIIDNLLEVNVLLENRIINKVSYLERLLISKEDNKAEAFTLKVGFLCNRLFDISNEDLSKRLKAIYNIRSMLVHGEENKIIDKIDYYKKVFTETIVSKQSKYETRFEILISVDVTLNLFFIRVLNRYLEDPNLCEYIKQN